MRLVLLLLLLSAASPPLADDYKPARFAANEGEVLEVDRKGGEIAIRHGPLPDLGMDPMSMIFKVADPAVLGRVKKGDRVKFKAGLVEGRFAVLEITPVGERRR